jgi:phage FluMu protein Com/uncharacterized protein YbaR (Trm112 family)
MITVRCTSCHSVFATNATSPHSRVRCPDCGATHRLATLASSTAGDSMMINPVALKQILETPRGPGAARAYEVPEPVILCPSCKVRLYVNRKKYGGKRVNCPECKQPMVIPKLAHEPAEAEKTEEEIRTRQEEAD